MNSVKRLIRRHQELINYAFWGIFATGANIITYYVTFNLLHIPNSLSTLYAWAASVLVAFITNKIWVFQSRDYSFRLCMREFLSFTGCRLFSELFDLGIMIWAVDIMHGDGLIWKLIANIIVIALNYFFSKFFIFRDARQAVHS